MNEQVAQLVGPLPTDYGLSKRMRFHQGWWRAFVLCQEPGPHPDDSDRVICNTIREGKENRLNFITDATYQAAIDTIHERDEGSRGIIEEDRLFNNLLSSQPLCFNFFGEMKSDSGFAFEILEGIFPHITGVTKTIFEYAPKKNYTADNSAFDVAFEVEAGHERGVIGLECKFTDTFSKEEFDKPEYRQIFSKSQAFKAEYETLIDSRFNQLFRNQLIAEALVLNGEYDFSLTGLFCHPEDDMALNIGKKFQSLIKNGETRFRIITYRNFIENAQQCELSWQKREMIMMLWSRYCAIQLSGNAFEQAF